MRFLTLILLLLLASPAWAGKAFDVDETSIEQLVDYLAHADWRFRHDAARELGRRKGKHGEEPLQTLALTDAEPRVRLVARAALEKMGSPKAVPVAEAQLLDDPETKNRQESLETIDRGGDARSALIVAAALEGDPEVGVRRKAAKIIGARKWKDGTKALVTGARNDEDEGVRKECLNALARIGGPDGREVLHDIALQDTDDKLRLTVVRAMEKAPLTIDKDVLLAALDDRYDKVQRHAARALVNLGDAIVAPVLREKAMPVSDRKVQEEFEEAADRLAR
jgi:HEAT repeat protein